MKTFWTSNIQLKKLESSKIANSESIFCICHSLYLSLFCETEYAAILIILSGSPNLAFLKLFLRNKLVWPFGHSLVFFECWRKKYILRTALENMRKNCNILWNSNFETSYFKQFFWRKFGLDLAFFHLSRFGLFKTNNGQIWPFWFFETCNPGSYLLKQINKPFIYILTDLERHISG